MIAASHDTALMVVALVVGAMLGLVLVVEVLHQYALTGWRFTCPFCGSRLRGPRVSACARCGRDLPAPARR